MAGERIELTVDLGSSVRDATALADGLKSVDSAGKGVAQTYQVLAVSGQGYELVEDQVSQAMDEAVAAAVRETQARTALNAVLAESTAATAAVGRAVEKTEKATGGMGRGMLQTSYAVQDFTAVLSGGGGLSRALGSVQNNIPEILAGLGLGAGLAGAVSIVSVGVGVLIDNWDRLGELFKASKFVVPALGSDMEGLSKSIQKINDAIAETEDLAAKDDKNAFFYRDRLEKLRRTKTEAESRLANKKVVEGVTFDDSDQARLNAGLVRRALANAGGGKQAVDAVMDRQGFDRLEAERTVAGALKGDSSDIRLVRQSFGRFEDEWRKISPVYEEARKQAAEAIKGAGDWLAKQVGDLRKSNTAAQKEAEKAATAAGREAEKQAREQERAAAAAARDAEKQAGRDQKAAAEAADLNRLRGLSNLIDRETGGALEVPQLEDAARLADQLMQRQHLGAFDAAAVAVRRVVENQARMMAEIDRTRVMWDQLGSAAQTVGTRLNRGR